MGLLTDRINNKLEKSNLSNEHALNREPVPLRLFHSFFVKYILSLMCFQFHGNQWLQVVQVSLADYKRACIEDR